MDKYIFFGVISETIKMSKCVKNNQYFIIFLMQIKINYLKYLYKNQLIFFNNCR